MEILALLARGVVGRVVTVVRRLPPAVTVGLVLGALLFMQRCHYQREAASWAIERQQLGLVADSVAAVLDTTRQTAAGAERRVLQLTLTRDSLSTALHREQKVNAELVGRIQTLHQRAVAPVHIDTVHDVRSADFTLDTVPVHIKAHVTLPPPPLAGQALFDVSIDSIPLRARIGCSMNEGVHRATLLVQTPPWLTVTIPSVQQDPAICNPPITVHERSWYSWAVPAALFLGGLWLGSRL